jgi:hypothetical protein
MHRAIIVLTKGTMMVNIVRLARDERSAVGVRHAATASLLAAASVIAGIFLTVASSGIYEQSSQRVLWALAGRGSLGA